MCGSASLSPIPQPDGDGRDFGDETSPITEEKSEAVSLLDAARDATDVLQAAHSDGMRPVKGWTEVHCSKCGGQRLALEDGKTPGACSFIDCPEPFADYKREVIAEADAVAAKLSALPSFYVEDAMPTFDEIVASVGKHTRVSVPMRYGGPCLKCGGTGKRGITDETCTPCLGTGREVVTSAIDGTDWTKKLLAYVVAFKFGRVSIKRVAESDPPTWYAKDDKGRFFTKYVGPARSFCGWETPGRTYTVEPGVQVETVWESLADLINDLRCAGESIEV